LPKLLLVMFDNFRNFIPDPRHILDIAQIQRIRW